MALERLARIGISITANKKHNFINVLHSFSTFLVHRNIRVEKGKVRTGKSLSEEIVQSGFCVNAKNRRQRERDSKHVSVFSNSCSLLIQF